MRIGEIRARGLRLLQYASIGTFAASVATAVKVGAFESWWVILGALALIVAAILDPKVFKGEFAYSNKNNEEWREAMEILRSLKK